MPFMWNESLATGIREIDLQHQELVEIGNALQARVRGGDAQGAVTELLPRLTAYALFHFSTEERLVDGLPDAEAHLAGHAAEHRAFAEKIAALREGAPGEADLLAFVDYLHGWLVGHICHSDKELAALVRRASRDWPAAASVRHG